MVEYVFISYVVMLLWCLWSWVIDDEPFKGLFKMFALSPISLPFALLCKVISW